jgi:hypothetical protein
MWRVLLLVLPIVLLVSPDPAFLPGPALAQPNEPYSLRYQRWERGRTTRYFRVDQDGNTWTKYQLASSADQVGVEVARFDGQVLKLTGQLNGARITAEIPVGSGLVAEPWIQPSYPAIARNPRAYRAEIAAAGAGQTRIRTTEGATVREVVYTTGTGLPVKYTETQGSAITAEARVIP